MAELLEQRALLSDGPVSLVKDINLYTAASNPGNYVRLGNLTLFRALDGPYGTEWFRTDGTAAGTALVKDINPGEASAFPVVGPTSPPPGPDVAVAGRNLYFVATDGVTGAELWKTDGTAGGTALVKDIRPGAAGSAPQYLTAAGDAVYFTANDGPHGTELWRSDGTEAGTRLVADLAPGVGSAAPVPLAAVGGRLLFAAGELWVTDGTAEGTALLKDISPGLVASSPGVEREIGAGVRIVREVLVADGQAYFPATDAAHGRELWRSDGTADGTVLVGDTVPGAADSAPRRLTDVGGSVYFTALPATASSGARVFRTDPASAAGVTLVDTLDSVRDFVVGSAGGKFFVEAQVRRTVGLFAHDPASPAGTGLTLLRTLARLPVVNGPELVADLGGDAYLLGYGTGASGEIELIRSDGTPGGTTTLYRRPQPGATFEAHWPWEVFASNGLVYFAGFDRPANFEPWRTDGTAEGTARLADVNASTLSGGASGVIPIGSGRGVFAAFHPDTGKELWITDGTDAGTSLVRDINPGPATSIWDPLSFPDRPVAATFNGRAYFAAETPGTGVELWATDGTPDGTVLVKDIAAGLSSSEPHNFIAFGGRLYFVASDVVHGPELWVTDGTPEGTTLVADVNPDAAWSSPAELTVAGDTLFFTADFRTYGRELWKTDGTAAGTVMVRDVDPYEGDGVPLNAAPALALLGGRLYFLGVDGGDWHLWRSDGTYDGTVPVQRLPVFAEELLANGGSLFFIAGTTAAGGQSVWVSDGTAAGTAPIAVPAANGPDLTNPHDLTAAGDFVYFFDGGPQDVRLWRTDGTDAGTVMVRQFNEGASAPQPDPVPLGAAEGLFYFQVTTRGFGAELWRSDGTSDGTTMVQDIRPGFNGSSPGNLGVMGDRIYLTANDGRHGTELMSMPLRPATATGRHVFYNNSAYDGRVGGATRDDLQAVAPDKRPLLPGGQVSFENVSGYVGGINGILLELTGGVQSGLTADDFDFRVGRGGDPTAWAEAPVPAAVTLIPRTSADPAGLNRYAITWADGAVKNTWLQVTVKANARTGLARPDAFSFGSLVGETGDPAGPARVSALDLAAVRRALNTDSTLAGPFDFNRDGRVNALDLAAVRANLSQALAPPATTAAGMTSLRRTGVGQDVLELARP